MKGENGTPDTPDWQVQPRPCGRDKCVCESPQHAVFIHGDRIGLEFGRVELDGLGEN